MTPFHKAFHGAFDKASIFYLCVLFVLSHHEFCRVSAFLSRPALEIQTAGTFRRLK